MSVKFQSSAMDEMPLDENYRPVSVMAIMALILAMLSSISIIVPAALIFAIAGLAVGILAVARIARHEKAVTGRRVAVAAICITLFFTGLTLTYQLTIQNYHQRVAIYNAKQWLNLVQANDATTAYTLTRPPRLRGQEKKGSAQQPLEGDIESFRTQPVIRAVTGVREEIEFVKVQKTVSHEGSTYWILEFALPERLGRENFTVNMQRKYDNVTKTAHWHIAKFTFVKTSR